MSAEISQAEMDKYFETGGKETPAALIEAEKIEAETPPEVEPVVKAETPKEDPEKTQPKPDGEVQVQVDGKTVPLSELLAERKERQAWQQTAAQQQQQLTETLKMLQDRAKTLPQAEQDAAPDPNLDPIGYSNWAVQKLGATVAQLDQYRQQHEKREQAQTQANQVLNWAKSQQEAFKATQPKYDDAFKFAADARHKELTALGITDPAQRQQVIDMDIAGLIQGAIQTGQNPAQMVWNYAQAKGFVVAEAKKTPDLDDKVKTITRGQEAAKGVSGTSGGAPSEINNLQDLAAASGEMDDEEFSKAFDKLVPKMKGKYV